MARRGLCGDVFLAGTPVGPRLTDVKVDTSVRRQEFALDAAIDGLAANAPCAFQARISKDGRTIKEFMSRSFQGSDLKEGRIAFTEKWMPDKLWDLHTPQNTCNLEVSLLDAAARCWIQAGPSASASASFGSTAGTFSSTARASFSLPFRSTTHRSAPRSPATQPPVSLERLQSFGINFVYTHNYGCEPGSHLSFAEILRAADDVGMLVSFSQPHFSHYEWQAPTPTETTATLDTRNSMCALRRTILPSSCIP